MYNIKRDGVEIASVEEKTYTDTGLTPETDYTYTVEIDGVENSSDSVTTKTKESLNIFVSNKELVWDDLPAWQQSDNGSLTLVSDNGDGTYTYLANFEWNNLSDQLTWLVDVLEFKNNQLKSGKSAFAGFQGETMTALPDLDTSNLTNMETMFNNAKNFNQPLDHFDTSNVASMSHMFAGATVFNGSLDNWDTSSVTDMQSMFWNAPAFDQPINHFNISSVTKMTQMFYDASAFNQPLDNWDTSNVTNMYAMFRSASEFNESLDNWNTSIVTNMGRMFNNAKNFNQDLSGWCVYRIRSKPDSFDGGAAFMGQDDKQPKWGQPC